MKKVKFNDNIQEFITYSYKEYDRSCIDHVLYRKITNDEMNNILLSLDLYKLYNMYIHKDSYQNNSYSTRKIFLSKSHCTSNFNLT